MGLAAQGYRFIAGVDEVGRGALAGPVSVGVVVIDTAVVGELHEVRDSKLLKPARREALVPVIRDWAHGCAVGHASAAEVDSLGLVGALREAGLRALNSVLGQGISIDMVLLDGNQNWLRPPPAQPSLFDAEFSSGDAPTEASAVVSATGVAAGEADPLLPVTVQIKADMTCQSVAAASVLAKVERDSILVTLSQQFPSFGWAVNKGYATAAHRSAIVSEGASEYHRRSWRLVAVSPVENTEA